MGSRFDQILVSLVSAAHVAASSGGCAGGQGQGDLFCLRCTILVAAPVFVAHLCHIAELMTSGIRSSAGPQGEASSQGER